MNIAIIGESCIDEYVYGTCDRVCPEAAALCFKNSGLKTTNPGMAANVYENLKKLDNTNKFTIDLITTSKPGIIKRRFIDKKYNSIVFREDVDDSCEKIDIKTVNIQKYDYIMISDYNKGFLSVSDIQTIYKKKKTNCRVFIDTKKFLNDIYMFTDFIKINSQELQQNIQYLQQIKNKTVLIVTQGENGATVHMHNTEKHFHTDRVILRDVCGAGDTFLAALVFSYTNNQNIEDAIIFANSCASKVVSKFGVATI